MQIGRIAEPLPSKKTGHLDPTGRVLQLQLNDRKVGIAGTGETMATTHRGHDRRCFAWDKGIDPPQRRIVDVVPWVVLNQIANQKQAEGGQAFGKLRADAPHLSERTLESRKG